MEKIMDSSYGVIIFYLIITILSFLIASNYKQNQEITNNNETYVANINYSNDNI